uniref:Malate dehydrogenase n=2 Tax=Compsopogon caeruleus TaxID=31354 RepID=A0A7S1TC16_9RHOD|mmetsp:Transcript_16896/g.35060  ORF Transcript_16896/g.35060 Transcript_16896/m.35060 type:complete len:447 (+) Transcript_16896:45-1385(+)
MSTLEQLRSELVSLLSQVRDSVTDNVRTSMQDWMARWDAQGGSRQEVLVKIASEILGMTENALPKKVDPAPVVEFQRVEFEFLEEFMKDVFIAEGAPEKEAAIAAHVLITADRRGIDSHGIGRLKPIYIDRIRAGIMKVSAPMTVVKETDTTALVDGNLGLGLVIGPRCMEICLDKAKKHGLGMVVVRNSTHYGAAGYYASMATDRGCIGVTGTNARPSIAPTFGVSPMLGTNPMTWGIPSDDPFPFVLDCATSVNQRGKIEKYAREGKPTPPGQVIDRSGKIRTDTEGILRDLVTGQCALAPLGGTPENGSYKGYGYATVVELLSSSLCDGLTSIDLTGVDRETGKKKPMPLGHWFLAIDIERFVELDRFKTHAGSFLRAMRASEKDPTGPGRIFTAGEMEYEAELERTQNGGTPLPPALVQDMKELRSMYPVLHQKYSKFPFET